MQAIFKLLSKAELNLYFASGKGVGAFLLALLALVFLTSETFTSSLLSDLSRSWNNK